MSATALRNSDWMAGFTELCDRLVHASVTAQGERLIQRGLIGLLLAAPFAIAVPAIFLYAGSVPVAVLLAGICGLFSLAWASGLLITVTGTRRIAGAMALAGIVALLSVFICTLGGLASPALALACVPVVEAWLATRERKAAVAGAVATASIIAIQIVLPWAGYAAAEPVAAAWLAVGAYALLTFIRLARSREPKNATGTDPAEAEIVIDLSGHGIVHLAGEGRIRNARLPSSGLLAQLALPDGVQMVDLVHLRDRVAFLSALSRARAGEEAQAEMRVLVGAQSPDQHIWIRISFAARAEVQADDLVAAITCIDEVVRLREELEVAQSRAAAGDAAKGRFLGAVSHELRTPLNAIIGFSDMLVHEMAGPFADPRQRDYVELIRQSGEHLLEVVNAILDVSKIEADAYPIFPEAFELAAAGDLCHSMMMPLAKARNISITSRIGRDIGEIVGDRRAIQQILINLLSNAVKFTPAGGTVTLSAVRYKTKVELVVKDSGIGIAPDDLDRLGQPFVQVCNDITRQFEGTGLGLSLVKGLVKLHEGELSIESAPGEGTIVRVVLPIDGPSTNDEANVTHLSQFRVATGDQDRGSDETIRKTA